LPGPHVFLQCDVPYELVATEDADFKTKFPQKVPEFFEVGRD
jgi:hypothetical protein